MLSLTTLALGNTAEISTGDVRKNQAFDNIKASVAQALRIGNLNTNLEGSYDYKANKDFFNEVTATGSILSPSKDKKGNVVDDVSLDYEITHSLTSASTNVELTGSKDDTGFGVKADATNGKVSVNEVSLTRDVDAGDQSVQVTPSWLLQSKTARVKLMSKLSGGDKLEATVDYATDGGDITYEVSLDHNIASGRDVSATFGGDTLDVDYTDNNFEDGATWTASASVPTSDASNILDAAKLSLKRSWTW